jgi:hypothetical protein
MAMIAENIIKCCMSLLLREANIFQQQLVLAFRCDLMNSLSAKKTGNSLRLFDFVSRPVIREYELIQVDHA